MLTLPRLGSPALLAFLTAHALFAQSKQSPASLIPEPFILLDSVVTEQWPAMLPDVNVPAQPTTLASGQCIRVGVGATGAGFEHFLDAVAIHAAVTASNAHAEIPLQPAASSKLIRPEGSDFVEGALAAGGLKNPLPISGVLAVSSSRWCVPNGAQDGSATFVVDVDLHGKHLTLHKKTIAILSVDSAAPFTDEKQFGNWLQSYDRFPEPGRLAAAINFLAADRPDDPNAIQFFVSAFAHDAPTARQLGPSIAKLPKHAKLLALAVASNAHVTLDQPPALSPEDQNVVASLATLSNPYDMSSGQTWKNLDLLWSEFLATGTRKPVAAIAQTLQWSSDYDAVLQMKAQGTLPPELTPSLIRGLTFGAARWSLGSFQKNDPLAADYIRALREDSATPDAVRRALANLNTQSPAASGGR